MELSRQVYHWVGQIPPGQVTTYGAIALLCGSPRAARAVGWALAGCRVPGLPCHRVVNRLGQLSPDEVFGPGRQRDLLLQEGVPFLPDGRIDLAHCLWLGPGEPTP